MALELYFTFAIEALQAEIAAGKYSNLRTFQYEYMRGRCSVALCFTFLDGSGL